MSGHLRAKTDWVLKRQSMHNSPIVSPTHVIRFM